MTIIHTDPALTDEGAQQCCHFNSHFLVSASRPRGRKCGRLWRQGRHLRSSRRGEMMEEDHRRGL